MQKEFPRTSWEQLEGKREQLGLLMNACGQLYAYRRLGHH